MEVKCPHCYKPISLVKGVDSVREQADSVDTSDLAEVMAGINRADLAGRDLEFFDKQMDRYEKWGSKTLMSKRQMDWLRDLSGRGF